MNFLYAMVGALEERHWSEVAKVEKARLLMELEDSYRLDEIVGQEAIDCKPETKRED
ncbi:MAG: TfoX/Sxy family DNA transformation protein [Candidatus Thiodiazotropha taylori]